VLTPDKSSNELPASEDNGWICGMLGLVILIYIEFHKTGELALRSTDVLVWGEVICCSSKVVQGQDTTMGYMWYWMYNKANFLYHGSNFRVPST
jgi:hypothetical protein